MRKMRKMWKRVSAVGVITLVVSALTVGAAQASAGDSSLSPCEEPGGSEGICTTVAACQVTCDAVYGQGQRIATCSSIPNSSTRCCVCLVA